MKVGELIALLVEMDEDLPIVLAKDDGGNDFSPLAGVGYEHYHALTMWHGDVYFTEEEPPPEAVLAVVLWPTV